jgi:5-methyltetrahydropteroyltriglutamate--homocysteine methyltransferase
MSPTIRTTVVGSYPVPEWLRVHPTRQGLIDAIMVVLKTQELAGIDLVADGELARFDVNHPETNGMIDYFIRPMSGIDITMTRSDIESFRRGETAAYRLRPAGIVRGPVGEGALNLADDFALARPLTDRPLKFTLTSPFMLAAVLMDTHYLDRRGLMLAIADVLARQVAAVPADAIQIDEANVTGHPQDGPLAAEAINRVLDAARSSEKGVHLCFGNYGGQTVQRGHWAQLVEFLNALHCDHVVLELARRAADELDVLRGVRPEIGLGIGVIDIKDNQVETPEVVARRIEHAQRILGPDRIRFVHPDCGFWMLPRSVADRKMAALVAGRDLVHGRDVV